MTKNPALWNPPFCGDSQMRIGADGTWYYQNSPINRPGMVHLFASILRREGDKYMLVTPVEKLEIAVEDAPFTGIKLFVTGTGQNQKLELTTNLDQEIIAGSSHPLKFERQPNDGFKPYCLVREGLWARLTRSIYQELVDLGQYHCIDDKKRFGVWSNKIFFSIADAEELDEPLI